MKEGLIKKNYYDYVIIITIALLIFGGVGQAFQPVRVFSIAIFPFIFFRNLHIFFVEKQYSQLFLYFLAVTLFSVLSLQWTINLDDGIKALLYYFTHLCIFLNLIVCSKRANNTIESFLLGWYILVWLSVPIALIELFFDKHLSISFYGENSKRYAAGGIAFIKRFSSVTFGNYNTYIMVLIFSLPFIFGRLFFNKKAGVITLLIIVFLIVILNASRGGIISSALMLGTFILFAKRNTIKINRRWKLVLFSVVFVSLFYLPTLFEQFIFRLQNRTIFEDNSRAMLFEAAYDIAKDYNFLGSGVGSLEKLMEAKKADINVPHNFLLEILSQYGILFVIPIFILLIKMFFVALSSKRDYIRITLLIALVSMPFLFIINSGYLYHPVLWVYFPTLYILMCNSKSESYG